MPGWVYAPLTVERGRVLVVPDIYGPSPFYHEVACRLADRGLRAVLVDYFHREGPLTERSRDAAFGRRTLLDEVRALRDLSAAIAQLREGQPAERQHVGVLGFCLAGQFALDLCAREADLRTVCFYAFPEGPGGEAGRPAPRPIELADRITGPILAFWGDQDYIPLRVVARFSEAMATHGVDYEHHVYEGAGHGFLEGLVQERPDSASAHDAFDRCVRFFLAGTEEVAHDRPAYR